jgi:hypothetical protein
MAAILIGNYVEPLNSLSGARVSSVYSRRNEQSLMFDDENENEALIYNCISWSRVADFSDYGRQMLNEKAYFKFPGRISGTT